jgi:DNA-binding transcriptional LysR family regulator
VDLVQIRYFLALAETLNFTRASERCNVTQPALTRSIQRLEDELGGPLLLRERNLTQLTDLGRAMLPLLQRTRAAAEAVSAEAANLRRRQTAPLRIGLCSLVTAAPLVPLLQELATRFAALELTLVHGTSARLTEMLLQGDLDAALLPEIEVEADRLNRWPLFEESLAVLAPGNHRFAELDAVSLAELAGEPLLVSIEEGCALRRALDRLCRSTDVEVQVRHLVSGRESIPHIVGAGLGVALISLSQPLGEGVISRRLAGPEARLRVVLTAVAGRPAGRAAEAFVKLARARDWCADRADPAA